MRARWTMTETALNVREAWMRLMRFTDEEIAQACADDPPVDLADELEQLRYAAKLKADTPTREVLEAWAVKR